ncbi:hypothetical protein PG995_000662 [Apiospora arundinis]|uniref:DUF6536 domain-containing protein n=1 Tax=Apiospora arundinis TaxID=335852 RepID=A0ABR2JA66_9PEZI
MDLNRLNIGISSATGWRQAATVNCAILVAMSITLLGTTIGAIANTNSAMKAIMFFEGTCDGGSAAGVNLALHLLINVVSTAVLASSNFFMQVLNAPSREEVDEAHARGTYLGIGVPSVRNAFVVSPFKTCCWMVLLLSSIPIHLVFNSAVFLTDQRASDFHLTIANEEFASGGKYYTPGASLMISGGEDAPGYRKRSDTIPGMSRTLYGSNRMNLTQSLLPDSPAAINISLVASTAAKWDRISAKDCYNKYLKCDGLREHRNVVVVADKPGGWRRSENWKLKDNQTKFWNPIVPADQPNSLWFAAQCAMYATFKSSDEPVECSNTCQWAMFSDEISKFSRKPPELDWHDGYTWAYGFYKELKQFYPNSSRAPHKFGPTSEWWHSSPFNGTYRSGLQGDGDLAVKYCLAEPIERLCHVGVSITLLLAVSVCVLVKTAAAIVVTCVLGGRGHEPLVTLGDAVRSFLCRADPVTAGRCMLSQGDARQEKTKHRKTNRPRIWCALLHRRWSVVPWSVWLTSYALFGAGISVTGYMMGESMKTNGLRGSFIESDSNLFLRNHFGFTEGVLLANSPQLLLSFCYLAYNSLFTRLQMAREWSLFASGYHPLRVTDPKGDQYSTYRLQLPYKYSIPLILTSIFLHWLLSNTLYVFISEGGYYGTEYFPSGRDDAVLPPNTAVAVGSSGYSLMALLCVSCVLVTFPLVLSFQKLPIGMVNVGSNSLAISASCHASPLTAAGKQSASPTSSSLRKTSTPKLAKGTYSSLRRRSTSLEDGDVLGGSLGMDGGFLEMQALASNKSLQQTLAVNRNDSELSYESYKHRYGPVGSSELFEQLSQSKIRWGVVEMPPEWSDEQCSHDNMADDGDREQPVGHLGFGVQGDLVRPPVWGHWYA